ncbi:MAG: hypothetical protein K2L64_03495 [Ureaplasma sp.]|nr:hypothetical protein [Ureaplasma sp.]MDE6289805.1 hypothetical protein [Ureaplasma sp.]
MDNFNNYDYDNSHNSDNEYATKVKSSVYEAPNNGFLKSKLIKSDSKILIQSLLWFGIGFIGVAGFGLLWTFILKSFFYNETTNMFQDNAMTTLFILLGVSLLGSIIFSIFTPFNRNDRGVGFTIFRYIFYILMYSLLFATISCLFIELEIPFYTILVAFAITGLLTLLCGLIGSALSIRGALTIGKMISVLFMLMFFGSLLSSFLMFWFIDGIGWWYMIYDVLLSIIMILFMIMTFYKIINASRMMVGQELSKTAIFKLGMNYGTEILSSFMIIFMLVIQFIVRRK